MKSQQLSGDDLRSWYSSTVQQQLFCCNSANEYQRANYRSPTSLLLKLSKFVNFMSDIPSGPIVPFFGSTLYALYTAPYVFEVVRCLKGRGQEVESARYFIQAQNRVDKYVEVHVRDIFCENPAERLADGYMGMHFPNCPNHPGPQGATMTRNVRIIPNPRHGKAMGGRIAKVVTGQWLKHGRGGQWGVALDQ